MDSEDDVIYIEGHAGVVPLSFGEARRVVADITALLAVVDPEPHRPTGLELVAERYGLEAVQAATPDNSDEPTVEMGRLIPPYGSEVPTESWLWKHPG